MSDLGQGCSLVILLFPRNVVQIYSMFSGMQLGVSLNTACILSEYLHHHYYMLFCPLYSFIRTNHYEVNYMSSFTASVY
jgi:hypothetical protein